MAVLQRTIRSDKISFDILIYKLAQEHADFPYNVKAKIKVDLANLLVLNRSLYVYFFF